MKLMKMVCSNCGGTNVLCDAYASWNTETQEWELQNTFDKGSVCDDCDGECRIDNKPIDPKDDDGEMLRLARAYHLAKADGWQPGDEDSAIEYCDYNDLDYEAPSAEVEE